MGISELFDKARSEVKIGNKDYARDLADIGIRNLVIMREGGLLANDYVENQPIEFWLSRFWNFLERNKLILN